MCQDVAFDNRAFFGVFLFVVKKKKKFKMYTKIFSSKKNYFKRIF